MESTLSEEMKALIQNGIDMLYEHRDDIQAEWKAMQHHLYQKGDKSAESLKFAIEFFSEFLLSDKTEDVEQVIKWIRRAWIKQFQRTPQPNLLIYIMTLLENAVNKAVHSDEGNSFQQHQAVQYLFSRISEEMLMFPFNEQLDLETLINQLVLSKQLPIEWIASVDYREHQYIVKRITDADHHFTESLEPPYSDPSLFTLSETLLDAVPVTMNKRKQNVYPLTWNEETLLICTSEEASTNIIPFLTLSLQILSTGEKAWMTSRREQQWKDSVILFNEWIMRSQSFKEAIENICNGFVNYLPFERCALFSYSTENQNGSGLFGYHFNDQAIKNIKVSIDSIPSIHKGLRKMQPLKEHLKNLQPLFISDASDGFPSDFVEQFHLESLVVAPIYVPSEGKLIGAALLDQGADKRFKVPKETFTALMKFGQSAGELLSKLWIGSEEDNSQALSFDLSKREIDVLKFMAEGASTTEAAEQLDLSEYTVRDYISSILKKLNAKNRTEAAVKAIRHGIIH